MSILEDKKEHEDLTPEERAELLMEAKKAIEEVTKGEYATFDEVFGDLSDDI
jgi:hypothetical protein